MTAVLRDAEGSLGYFVGRARSACRQNDDADGRLALRRRSLAESQPNGHCSELRAASDRHGRRWPSTIRRTQQRKSAAMFDQTIIAENHRSRVMKLEVCY
jgi:hypothetical protein